MENLENMNWEDMEKKRMEQYYKSLNKQNNWQSLNEVQNLNTKQNNWQSLNEVSDLKQFNQYENLNDKYNLGIDIDFEVRVNGEVQNKKPNTQPLPPRKRFNDIYKNENLNEVVQNNNPEYIKMEEKVYADNDMDILEWFNKVSNKAMLDIYEKYKNK